MARRRSGKPPQSERLPITQATKQRIRRFADEHNLAYTRFAEACLVEGFELEREKILGSRLAKRSRNGEGRSNE